MTKASLSYSFAALVLGVMAVSCGQAPPPEPSTPAATARPVSPAPAELHWSYEGDSGPSAWGGLNPAFSACSEGRSQSPIDITDAASESLPEMSARFASASLRIVHHEHMADAINNGHTIQVNYSEGDTLSVGEQSYELNQYHFHSPSEHTLEGNHFPMEMHMVHKASDGSLAVIGVFIEEGSHNPAFDPIWANLPGEKGVESHFESVNVDIDELLPESQTTYRYDGSLTTPPCSEGVKWFIATEPIELSSEQIQAFTALITGNNRPVQPLNDRTVVTDRVDGES